MINASKPQKKLRETGLQIQPTGFHSKNLIACNFCNKKKKERFSKFVKRTSLETFRQVLGDITAETYKSEE